MRSECTSSDFPMPSDSATLPRSTARSFHTGIGLSREASRVRIFRSLVKALGWLVSEAAYGMNTLESLANYDHDTQSWKTLEPSLFEDSMQFSGRLPKSGTMRNGKIYAPQTWERRTEGNESGLWRTPQAANATQGPKSPEKFMRCLETNESMITLTDQVRMWPTPTVNDSINSTLPPSQITRDNLPGALLRNGQCGQLNPTWVEWLMGYPLGWTASNALEIRLSLKSAD